MRGRRPLDGRKNRSSAATLGDRKRVFLELVHLLDGRNAEQISTAVIVATSDLAGAPAVIADLGFQGVEMGGHGDLARITGVFVDFCDSASSRPRGRNKDTNGIHSPRAGRGRR